MDGFEVFDEGNFGDEVWNNATEDDHGDPRAGLGAAENFEGLGMPSNLLGDAGESSFEASLAAEELRMQEYLQRLAEIDAEDRDAMAGLYEQAPTGEDDGAFCDNILAGTHDIHGKQRTTSCDQGCD